MALPAVKMVSNPVCAECSQPIIGPVIRALDTDFHPDCFVCSQCRTPFNTSGFALVDSEPWCELCVQKDSEAKGGPAPTFVDTDGASGDIVGAAGPHGQNFQGGKFKCVACDQLIMEKAVGMPGTFFHPECFTCKACGQAIDATEGFVHNDNFIYHEQCFKDRVAPRCASCDTPLVGKFVKAPDGLTYHPDCFCCFSCSRSLSGLGFAMKFEVPWCGDCLPKAYDPNTGPPAAAAPAAVATPAPAPAAPAAAAPAAASSDAAPRKPKFCTECGTAVTKKFCPSCGKPTGM